MLKGRNLLLGGFVKGNMVSVRRDIEDICGMLKRSGDIYKL